MTKWEICQRMARNGRITKGIPMEQRGDAKRASAFKAV
jgi:hypothetical protein